MHYCLSVVQVYEHSAPFVGLDRSELLRAGARRARASLGSEVEKERQTVSDYTTGRYLVRSRKAEEIGGHD